MKITEVIFFVYLVVLLFLGLGWILNVVSFAKSDFEDPYYSEVVRGVGVFVPPFGGIIGYMDIGDEGETRTK